LSLKSFHFVFISICTALSVFLILWGFQSYRLSANDLGLDMGIVGIIGLLVLIPYSLWVRKKFKKIQMTLLVGALLSSLHPLTVQACAVCFGDPNSDLSKGIKAGVIVLILVVGGVLGGIASIAISWSRRAKALESS